MRLSRLWVREGKHKTEGKNGPESWSFHPVMSVQEVELELKRGRKSVIVGSLPRGFGDADLWCKQICLEMYRSLWLIGLIMNRADESGAADDILIHSHPLRCTDACFQHVFNLYNLLIYRRSDLRQSGLSSFFVSIVSIWQILTLRTAELNSVGVFFFLTNQGCLTPCTVAG